MKATMTKIGNGRQTGKTTTIAKLISLDVLRGKNVGVVTPNYHMFKNVRDMINEYIPIANDQNSSKITRINKIRDMMGVQIDCLYIDEYDFIDHDLLIEVLRLSERKNIPVVYS